MKSLERIIWAAVFLVLVAGGLYWGELRHESGFSAGIFRGMQIQKGESPSYEEVFAIVKQKIEELKFRQWVLRRLGVSGASLDPCPFGFDGGPRGTGDRKGGC